MSFYNLAQPNSENDAEPVNIIVHDNQQQLEELHDFTMEEEILILDNDELASVENDNLQFGGHQPANNFTANNSMEEEILISDNHELANVMGDDLQLNQLDNFMRKEESMIFETNNSIQSNYTTLLSMFPNVESQYIKQICIKPPFEKNEGDCLTMLINHLLSYEEKIDETLLSELHEEQEKNTTMNDQILSEMLEMQDREVIEEQKRNEQLFSEFLQYDKTAIDEKMEILENILPDADPNILREFIEKNHENADLLEQFVASNLKNKNYQKRDQYYAKLKIKEKIEQYTTKFDVEKFIQQFPEPYEYFENPERKSTSQVNALKFLMNRYNFDNKYVEKVYASTQYNLSLADKHLNVINGVNPATEFNIEIDDIPLLQEIAFIQNKGNIKKYLQVMKKKEEEEMSVLRAQKLLLECQCCYNDIKPTECIECDNNHIFCKRCIIKGTNLALSNNLISVNCFMGSDCNSEFSFNVLKKILPFNTFEVLLNKQQEFEIKAANLDDLVNCPFCRYSMILEPQIQIFACKNPECMKITCRLCKRMNHLPIKCEDVLDEHKGRLFVEEEMSKELIRYCPKCNTPFVKKGGCNHMTCRCGASLCYICKRPWNMYNHNQCKQNSDEFEQEQVELKRVEALSKLKNDFPDLKLLDI